MLLAPYYRQFELAWEGDTEASVRFRRILRVGLVALLLFGILIPLLPSPPRLASEEAVPKIEPEKKIPVAPPQVNPEEQARQKAQKQLNQVKDELADLREEMPDPTLADTKNLTGAVGADSHAERSLITSKVGVGSGGITSANTSRGFGSGAGSLTGHETTAVTSSIARS